jgi:hypothetical protein
MEPLPLPVPVLVRIWGAVSATLAVVVLNTLLGL